MPMRFSQRTVRGITLIETVVFVGVLVFIIGAIVGALRYTYQGQRFAFEQADAIRSARAGIDRIVRELREVSYADTGAYSIESMSTSSLVFFSDFDNDGSIERVRYFLDGTELKRGVTESTSTPPVYTTPEAVSVVSDHIRNETLGVPLFTLYDKDGNEMSNFSDVDALAFVLVRLVANVDPLHAPVDYELRSSAALRNVH